MIVKSGNAQKVELVHGDLAHTRFVVNGERKLRIEAALRVEADLTGKYGAVMKPPSRFKSGGIEVGRPPLKAQRIVEIAGMHGPPVRTETNHGDVHAFDPAHGVFKTAGLLCSMSHRDPA